MGIEEKKIGGNKETILSFIKKYNRVAPVEIAVTFNLTPVEVKEYLDKLQCLQKIVSNKGERKMIKEKFTAENSAMLLIDHQVGTMGWVRSTTFEEMKMNALVLAKSAKVLDLPVVLTSSMEEYAQGPLLEELKEILPREFDARVKRVGVVNAMDDENFATAVKNTGRKKIIIAGVTHDVCVVYPAITAVSQGYDVQVVVDAGGSPTTIADETALRRMEQSGVILTSTNQLIAELAGSWATEKGGKLVQILMEDVFSKIK